MGASGLLSATRKASTRRVAEVSTVPAGVPPRFSLARNPKLKCVGAGVAAPAAAVAIAAKACLTASNRLPGKLPPSASAGTPLVSVLPVPAKLNAATGYGDAAATELALPAAA